MDKEFKNLYHPALARLLRTASVSGWSSPSTRRQSVSVCSYSGMARPRSPAAW